MIVPDVDPLLHTHDSRSPRHEAAGTAGNLTTDAHLAALAIEHRAELHSTGADMARFPGFNRVNPLV